jgi:ATP-dependent DNA ligase
MSVYVGPGATASAVSPRLPHPSWFSPRVHEIKHDGYRLIGRRDDNRVRLYTRRRFNWSHRFPLIVRP